jgi:hypothetical protein
VRHRARISPLRAGRFLIEEPPRDQIGSNNATNDGCSASTQRRLPAVRSAVMSQMPESERVEPIGIDLAWLDGAPDPLVLYQGSVAALVLNLDPSAHSERIGMILWSYCIDVAIGPPNDETRSSHPLWRRGLSNLLFSGEVFGSARLNGMESSVHHSVLQKMHHYIVLLKENTFECVCMGYETSTHTTRASAVSTFGKRVSSS